MFRKVQRNAPDVLLEQRVRRDVDFLFAEYRATLTSNVVEAPGICEFAPNAANVEFKFTNSKPDADYSIVVAPRNLDGIWEMLHVALAAATSDDARSLIIPVFFDDELSQISCVGLTQGS